jgi:alpha-mannosidase
MDLAWLWTIDETYTVYKQTFENILELMKKHPEFTYSQSMAQMFKWAEKQQPKLFQKVKEKVEEGKWELVGGTWVEFDCNIPSGESLVRQFLYGKRYFSEKFGVDVQVCWLPDSFGNCWTLPQIMAKSGMKYFLTQKLRWNDMTRFTKNIFRWRGIGDFEVLAHQTLGKYDSRLTSPDDFLGQLGMLKRRHSMNDLLILYGMGDHGGGPAEEDLENALKWKSAKDLPDIKFTTALRYFQMLEEIGKEKFPVVDDELYLEYHRGTYTTQAKVKMQNRKAEVLLENAEKMAAIAKRYGFAYPKRELTETWETVLLNQFHDILCGSCIEEVYEDCDRDYDKVFKTAERIIRDAAKAIASHVKTQGEGKALIVFNTLSWDRDGTAEVNLEEGAPCGTVEVKGADGNTVPSHITRDGEARKLVFACKGVPSMGYKVYKIVERKEKESIKTDLNVADKDGKITLENSKIKATVDKKTGLVISIYDKLNKREALASKGITLQIFEDKPVEGRKNLDERCDAAGFDAWEIYIFQQPDKIRYVELNGPEEVKIADKSPLKATVEAKYRYRQEGRPDSTFKMQVTLCSEAPMLQIGIEIDWHTLHRLAKMAFPLDVEGEYATYEIPYGYINRRNPLSPEATLSERAKWEVPGQKWIDYTDAAAKYGISILNDCKYGFDQVNNVLRVTLLRSPIRPASLQEEREARAAGKKPDETMRKPTDQGKHEIKLAVYPHKGNWRDALTVRKAYEFNYPFVTHFEEPHGGDLASSHSFISVKPQNVILSAMKEAEDTSDTILRLYETDCEKTEVELSFDWKPKKASETDLLEKELGELKIGNESLKMAINRNEIKTLKLRQ